MEHREACLHRLKMSAKKIVILLLCGLLYLMWYRTTHIGIPCVFRLVTHLKCPGCGMTHAMVSLSHMHVAEAFQQNKLSVTIVPVLMIMLAVMEYRYIKTGQHSMTMIETILAAMLLFLSVIYMIIRNIDILREWRWILCAVLQ